jgi:hypothetical protein
MSLAGTSRHFAAMQNLVIADIEQTDPMSSRLARCRVARSRIGGSVFLFGEVGSSSTSIALPHRVPPFNGR